MGYNFKPKQKRRRTLFKITGPHLADIFNVSTRTIRRYIEKGLLDPTDVFDIVDKARNRHLLDKRRKQG